MEKPLLKNRYGSISDYKVKALLGMVSLFLTDGKTISIFVNGQGFVYEIGDEILKYLKDKKTDCSGLNMLNYKSFKTSLIPTDVSIALDGTVFENDKWMYQSHLNIIIE
jgi:hypothetical protein